jgi:hypothetical protein
MKKQMQSTNEHLNIGVMGPVKSCGPCGRTLSVTEFHKNNSRPDGLADQCKECKKVYAKKWYSKKKKRLEKRKRAQATRLAKAQAKNQTPKLSPDERREVKELIEAVQELTAKIRAIEAETDRRKDLPWWKRPIRLVWG